MSERALIAAIEALTKEIVKLRAEIRPPHHKVEHLTEKTAPAMSCWIKWLKGTK